MPAGPASPESPSGGALHVRRLLAYSLIGVALASIGYLVALGVFAHRTGSPIGAVLQLRVPTPSAAASVPPGAVSAPQFSVSPAPAAVLPFGSGAMVTP